MCSIGVPLVRAWMVLKRIPMCLYEHGTIVDDLL